MSLVSLFSLLGIFILLPLLVRSRLKNDQKYKVQKENGEFIEVGASSAESGYHNSYQIPKDRDAYARIFVPDSHKDGS